MIHTEINKMIMQAMKDHESVLTETLRAVKAAFLNWQTSKENAGKQLSEADEIQIIKKMVKQRQDSVEQYKAAHRQDLAEAEEAQIVVLEKFLPAEATEEEITQTFLWIRDGAGDAEPLEPIKKNMGVFIKEIKKLLPNADGKMLAQVVQKQLN